MVILRKKRKARKTRRATPRKRASVTRRRIVRRKRRNPSMKTIRRRRKVASKNGVMTRPRLYKYKRRVYRGPRSRSKFSRINPRRRRYRRNPVMLKGMFSKNNLITYASMAAGMVGGMMAMPFVVKAMRTVDKTGEYDKYYGVVHVVLGGLLVGFVKNKNAKLAGTTLAATGLYDLIASNTDFGLIPLPRISELADNALPDKTASAAETEEAVSANYALRGSYPVPGITGSRSVNTGITAVASNYQLNGSFDENMPGDTAWD